MRKGHAKPSYSGLSMAGRCVLCKGLLGAADLSRGLGRTCRFHVKLQLKTESWNLILAKPLKVRYRGSHTLNPAIKP